MRTPPTVQKGGTSIYLTRDEYLKTKSVLEADTKGPSDEYALSINILALASLSSYWLWECLCVFVCTWAVACVDVYVGVQMRMKSSNIRCVDICDQYSH